jgi:hypothetical protein
MGNSAPTTTHQVTKDYKRFCKYLPLNVRYELSPSDGDERQVVISSAGVRLTSINPMTGYSECEIPNYELSFVSGAVLGNIADELVRLAMRPCDQRQWCDNQLDSRIREIVRRAQHAADLVDPQDGVSLG